MAATFTDAPRNVAVFTGIMVRTKQADITALNKELLAAELTAKELLEYQCQKEAGQKLWDDVIKPLL